MRAHVFIDGNSIDEFHDDIRHTVGRASIDQTCNVGVAQVCEDSSLGFELFGSVDT